MRFALLPARRFGTVGIPALIEDVRYGSLIADKAFDSDAIIAALNDRGARVVTSQYPRRAGPLKIDTEVAEWRHLIENFSSGLKAFKRIAMRGGKAAPSFSAMTDLAAARIHAG